MQLPRHSLIPGNDEDRLLALSRYNVLGTAPDGLFDEFATLTAKLFGAPIALISLVAESSVWFKANFGLPGSDHLARTQSLCSVAVLQNQATVFADLKTQPCTLIEPQVLEALQLQFYAGYPLQTPDGFNIGTLCVIDRQPRSFSQDEQRLLQHLAATVMLLLELRRAAASRAQSANEPPTTFLSLLHSLTLLAEVGSTGVAVDRHGAPVPVQAIHHEAGHLAALLNRTITEALGG